jgi:hypothetical protein
MEQDQIASAVDSIASDIGLGGGDAEHDDEVSTVDTGTDTETVSTDAADTSTDTDTSTDAEKAATATAAAVARAAPKAWAKEQHDRWGKLDKETQDYIEHREKQMLDGLTQYGDRAKYGDSIQKALQPYEPYIKANNIDAPRAVTALFEAHKGLAEGSIEQRTAYLAKVAKNYGIDLAKAASLSTASQDEPASVRELRERTERLEQERNNELSQRDQELRTKVATEVSTFEEEKDDKGNLKHPHFAECWEDIVALIKAGHALSQAYEKAVYANPVTRAKEIARLQKESEATLRAKAKQEAEKARNTTRTNVTSRDTRRALTASKATKWEDGLDETMKEIKSRNTTH